MFQEGPGAAEIPFVTTVRCPSCDAAVPADAAWCTLCFAQLGAQVETGEPAPPAPPAPAAMVPAPLLSAPVLAAPLPTQAPAVAPTATVTDLVEQAGPATPTWPCTGCGENVSLEETECPACGAGFMGGINPSVSLMVPVVGDLGKLSPGGQFGVMAGGATVLTILLVLAFLILGHIF